MAAVAAATADAAAPPAATEHGSGPNDAAALRLRLLRRQVESCAVERWYSEFAGKAAPQDAATPSPGQHRRRCTFRSVLIPLADSFRDWLRQDGIVLPEVPEGVRLPACDPRLRGAASEDTYEAFGDVDWDAASASDGQDSDSAGGSSAAQPPAPPQFPAMEQSILDALDVLGDDAFVKLSWTSPRDASWMCGSLKVQSPGDVFLLLKSSDFVQHDLDHVFANCVDSDSSAPQPHLTLRSWCNLSPSNEFRCFVYDGRLVAIVQRHPQTFYQHLASDQEAAATIRSDIVSFFESEGISGRFPETRFTFDVYVDSNRRVWLVDFGPLPELLSPDAELNCDGFCEARSNAMLQVPPHELLSWPRLAQLVSLPVDAASLPEFLTVESREQATSFGDVRSAHRVPVELVRGELTQDIVDQAKAQLDGKSAAGSR